MLMAYVHAHLAELVRTESNPANIITTLNRYASYDNETCIFATLFFGTLDLATGCLQYTNAGHNPPYILSDELTIRQFGIRKLHKKLVI